MGVRIGSFGDRIEAELARARLSVEGIDAVVLEPAGFNPMLNDAAGGVQLQVAVRDLERARAILAEPLVDLEDDEPAVSGIVRCPECELEYCFFERPHLSGLSPGAVGMVALAASVVLRLGKKRWRCHKCGHAWDDPAAGPKQRTPSKPGDPRPVFLLRRTSVGIGLFIGLLFAIGGWVAHSPTGTVVLIAAPLAGWLLGRGLVRYVCSEPTCRAPLSIHATTCDKCGGSVAGSIDRSGQHYREVARFRRELAALPSAALREAARPNAKPRKKKARKPDHDGEASDR